jgi:thiol-disulfide isomerase/thioredoxin
MPAAACLLATIAALLLAACGGAEPPALGAPITVAQSGATHPTVAIDAEQGIHYVAWIGMHEGQANVYIARSRDGVVFGAPARVNDVPGDAAPHEQAPAQVAVGPRGAVYVVWQNNHYADGRRFPYSDLRFARSTDGGRTFGPAITVNDDAGMSPASHTFHDLVVAKNGTVYVSWIDGRARAAAERTADALATVAGSADTDTGEHTGHGSETETLPPQEIRLSWSADGGQSFGASNVIGHDPCPCCRTSLAVTPDGAILLGWRGIFTDNVRDIVIARSIDGGATFTPPLRVHEDGWRIEGCPHAGPSIATTADGNVTVAWYTGADGKPGVFHAVSSDGGQSFGEARELMAGEWVPISRPRLAASGTRVLAAWDDARTDPSRPMVAWIGTDGVAGDTLGSGGAFPVVAAAGPHYMVAWLDGDRIHVRTAAAQPLGRAAFRPLLPGGAAPDYAALSINGDSVSLAALEGDAILLNVWATWCIPCRDEMPALERLQRERGPEGLRVIGVNIDTQGDTQVRGFVEDIGITFTVLLDPRARVTRAFRTTGVPETILLDRRGFVAKRWIGAFDPFSNAAAREIDAALEDGA